MAGESIIRVLCITVLLSTLTESDIDTVKDDHSTDTFDSTIFRTIKDRSIPRKIQHMTLPTTSSQSAMNNNTENESDGDLYEYRSNFYDHDYYYDYYYDYDYYYGDYTYDDSAIEVIEDWSIGSRTKHQNTSTTISQPTWKNNTDTESEGDNIEYRSNINDSDYYYEYYYDYDYYYGDYTYDKYDKSGSTAITAIEDRSIKGRMQHENISTTISQPTKKNNTETESEDNSYQSNINDDDYYDYYYDYYDDYGPDYDHNCVSREYSASMTCCHWQCAPDWLYNPHHCNCDDMCQVYNDCCESTGMTSDQNFTMANVSFDCLYMPDIYDLWFVYIVKTCPDGTEYELNKLCTESDEQNIYSTTPTTSFSTRVLYRNMYCAMCNRVEDYVFWKAVLRCH